MGTSFQMNILFVQLPVDTEPHKQLGRKRVRRQLFVTSKNPLYRTLEHFSGTLKVTIPSYLLYVVLFINTNTL